MNIGSAEIIDEIEEPNVMRPSRVTGPGSGRGGGKNNNGGDGPDDDDAYVDDRDDFTDKKSRILTGFVLVVAVMTFGGLLAAYIFIASNKVDEWRPFALPTELWVSTFIIMLSSVAYVFGNRATQANNQRSARKWFLITGGLGVGFVMSQTFAWIALSMRGMVLQGNPYAGFFYMLTVVHALHVLGGLTALGTVIYRSWIDSDDPAVIVRRKTLARVVGWYWHFMGGLWIILFVVLGFWK